MKIMRKMFLLGGVLSSVSWLVIIFIWLVEIEIDEITMIVIVFSGIASLSANLTILGNKHLWQSLSKLSELQKEKALKINEANIAIKVLKDKAFKNSVITREELSEVMTEELGYEWKTRDKL